MHHSPDWRCVYQWMIANRDVVIAGVIRLLERTQTIESNTMPLPDFDHDERYLIDFAKSPKAIGQSNSYMWGYLIGAAVLAGFGAYNHSTPMMVCAFVVVCGFRIYEELFQAKWVPLWGSIIEKYESAIIQLNDAATDDPADLNGD